MYAEIGLVLHPGIVYKLATLTGDLSLQEEIKAEFKDQLYVGSVKIYRGSPALVSAKVNWVGGGLDLSDAVFTLVCT